VQATNLIVGCTFWQSFFHELYSSNWIVPEHEEDEALVEVVGRVESLLVEALVVVEEVVEPVTLWVVVELAELVALVVEV